MTPNPQSFVDELTKIAEDKKRTVIPNSAFKAPGANLSESQARAQQHEPVKSKKTIIPHSAFKQPTGPRRSTEGVDAEKHDSKIHLPEAPRPKRGAENRYYGGGQYQVPPDFDDKPGGAVHPEDEPKAYKPSKGPVPAGPKGKTVIPWKSFPAEPWTAKSASPTMLVGFVDELEKNAFIAKALRLLETPIPGTPKLLMKVRGKAELAARETARREKIRDVVNENIYKGLKKARIDKVYQKLEPAIGNLTAPAAERALYGDRQIHAIAHRPLHWLLGNAPIPYVGTAHNTLVSAAQKALNVPAARAYKMPGSAAQAAEPTAAKAVEKAIEKAPPGKRDELKKKIKSALGMGAVAAAPSGAIIAGEQ